MATSDRQATTVRGTRTRPLLLDTDVGTDVDDLLALALIPALEGADLVGITTVYGDTDLRARIASVACDQLGLAPRIVAGEREPLSGRPVFWAGHEGHGIGGLEAAPYDHDIDAVGLLCQLAAEHAGALEIIAIGPLTNLATAILTDPDFAPRISHLYAMGGDFRPDPPRPEHNFRSDAVATWIVLHAGIPTTICGYDITSQILLSAPDLARIESANPAGALLADQTRRFWQWQDTWVPSERRQANSPHDPMSVLTAFRPELFDLETVQVDVAGRDGRSVEAGSVTAAPSATGPIQVVRDARFAEVKETIVGGLATAAR